MDGYLLLVVYTHYWPDTYGDPDLLTLDHTARCGARPLLNAEVTAIPGTVVIEEHPDVDHLHVACPVCLDPCTLN
jgi:hypothetical protein